jgi:hypothetical protein
LKPSRRELRSRIPSGGRRRAQGCRFLAFAFCLCATASVAQTQPPADTLLAQRLEAHINFLADDLLRGRQPGTPGYDIAAAYVASQFAQTGLSPAGEQGGWYQQVPMRRTQLVDGSATLGMEMGGKTRRFIFVDEFFAGPDIVHEQSELRADTVFAGYGIHAPELAHSDYESLDVKGKVVVILSGQPAAFPSEEGAHFASYREKHRAAVQHGAVGLIRVHTPRRDRRVAWERYASRVGAPGMGWIDASGQPYAGFPELGTNAILHHEAAAALFEGAANTLDQLVAMDEAGDPLPGFPLGARVFAAQRSKHDFLTSPNIVGLLPGGDPLLAGEFLVYTAHLDHIGELRARPGEDTDVINNGALDNASGISVLIETARALSQGERPRRSVLFIAVTAEEKGLVGSEYFAQNPTVPLEAMVGAINLDMPLLLYDFGDVIAFGAEHSSLGDAVGAAAAEFGVALTPDPMPEQNIFVRSDHYRFVQQGIPAVFLVTGPTAVDGLTDTAPIFEGFLEKHYHKPSDDLELPIDYGAAVRFTRINARVGEIVANQPGRPRWVEGDFFGTTYAR